MTKQAKTTAATKAASQKVVLREAIKKAIARVKGANTSLAKAVYAAAMTARAESATESEFKAMLAEIPKQRRADFKRIVGAPDKHFGHNAPENLVKLAIYLKHRAEGASDQDAATWTEKGKPRAKSGASGQTDQAAKADNKSQQPAAGAKGKAPERVEGSSLALIQRGIEQARSEYGGDKSVDAILSTLETAAGKLASHLAKVKSHEAA